MKSLINYSSKKVIRLILYGSLIVAIVLTMLLVVYDIWIANELRLRTIFGMVVIAYLYLANSLLVKGKTRTVSWLLVILCACLAFATLLHWGLNSSVGIFATSFIIILSGFLLGSRSIIYVTVGVVGLLLAVQSIHSLELLQPDLKAMSEKSNFMDVISYSTILGIFSLITWMSSNQIEKTLQRAQDAEKSIRAQKNVIAVELEKESTQLRELRLSEIQRLHKFATLGQSTAATLHELSNHLTVLNMDLVDLKQQNMNSKAIQNAEEGIEHIYKMVRQARRQLNTYDESRLFNGYTPINQAIKDLDEKLNQHNVKLTKILPPSKKLFYLKGSPLALMQIITILLNNAIDATDDTSNPYVLIKIQQQNNMLVIRIEDNGPGIDPELRSTLFNPIASKKPSGLGVGLYIAHHLAHTQFNGSLELIDSKQGAVFIVKIPKS